MQILPSRNAFAEEIREVSLKRLQATSLWLETLARCAELRGAPDLDDVLALNETLNQEISLRAHQSHRTFQAGGARC